MSAGYVIRAFWFLVAKDLVGEVRARRAWPTMVLLGLLLLVLVEMQLDLPTDQKHAVTCGLLWVIVLFAGTLALERFMAGEREDGCWRTLFMYPCSPAVVYVAKMAVNFIALAILEAFLIPAFVVFTDAPLLQHPLALALVFALGNIGFVSVGILVSALTSHSSQRGGLLALVLLPLLTPVLVGAAEATRLTMPGSFDDPWWNWMQLLAAFAVLFTTVGLTLFSYAVEE